MYAEYALDPDGLIDSALPKMLLDVFGKDSGRMLTALQDPRDWAIYIQQEIERRKDAGTIRPQQFLRVQTALEPLLKTPEARNERFFPQHPRRPLYNTSASWTENALSAHRIVPFAAVITNDCKGTVSPDDLDLEDPAFVQTPSTRVPRNAASLVQLLDSLLAVSTKLVLIDPHFQPREERFQALLPAIFDQHPHFKQAQIYLKDDFRKPCDPRDFADWNCSPDKKDNLLLPGESLKITLLKERRQGEKLHARYLLTEVGGVAVDPGLDIDTRPNSGNTFLVTRLSSKIHRELWHEYVHRIGFQIVTEFTIMG